jgi:hypothetical protein
MSYENQTAERLRHRAKTFRAMAGNKVPPSTRDVLLSLAADYECRAHKLKAMELLNQTESAPTEILAYLQPAGNA